MGQWRKMGSAVVAFALGIGCSNGPQRSFANDSTVTVDIEQPDVAPADVAMDAADVRTDARADGASDGALDARSDVARDGSADAGEGGDAEPRDIPIESSVLGCMTNMDCGSASLYCNGSTCDGRGFCTPRPDPMTCASDSGADETVCGCNGMTYPSLCALQAAGVRLVSFGMCPRD